jgi:hypothetical protein
MKHGYVGRGVRSDILANGLNGRRQDPSIILSISVSNTYIGAVLMRFVIDGFSASYLDTEAMGDSWRSLSEETFYLSYFSTGNNQ